MFGFRKKAELAANKPSIPGIAVNEILEMEEAKAFKMLEGFLKAGLKATYLAGSKKPVQVLRVVDAVEVLETEMHCQWDEAAVDGRPGWLIVHRNRVTRVENVIASGWSGDVYGVARATLLAAVEREISRLLQKHPLKTTQKLEASMPKEQALSLLEGRLLLAVQASCFPAEQVQYFKDSIEIDDSGIDCRWLARLKDGRPGWAICDTFQETIIATGRVSTQTEELGTAPLLSFDEVAKAAVMAAVERRMDVFLSYADI